MRTQHMVLTDHLADMDGPTFVAVNQDSGTQERKTNLLLRMNLSILMRGAECGRKFQRHKLMLYHGTQASSSTPKKKR